jgi:nucleoside-diphosphate-sugar epimerase
MVLVTGASGIVGTHVLAELLRTGTPIRALKQPGSDRSACARVLEHYGLGSAAREIAWIEADILDAVALRDAVEGVRRIYHAAALVSFHPGDADRLHAVNVRGTALLVDMAIEAGVERLCHVSSTAALGTPAPSEAADEATPWDEGRHSAYASSKHLAELEVHRGIAEGLDAVIVNPSVVLGPGRAGRSSMALIERLRRGTKWYTRGTNAFVDARDVAGCMVALMERGATGERYVLAGQQASYRELFNAFGAAFGHAAPKLEAAPWMLAVAWRAERIRRWVTGGTPLVTRASVSSATSERLYSSGKVRAFLGYRFRPLSESVANIASFLGKR